MFDSLEQKIEEAEGTAPSVGRQVLRYGGFLLVSIVIFAALYAAIRLL